MMSKEVLHHACDGPSLTLDGKMKQNKPPNIKLAPAKIMVKIICSPKINLYAQLIPPKAATI